MSASQPIERAGAPDLPQLLAQAQPRALGGLAYAGEVEPEEAYAYLESRGGIAVDVRTVPEWQFVGVPNLSGTKGALATISWKQYPDFSTNPRFAEALAAVPGITPETPLFFLCRSGGRSLDAAVAMTALGYRYCFNVSDGFEGEPDASAHRGVSRGWKAKQLPWKQG